jgi:hypothetical protein
MQTVRNLTAVKTITVQALYTTLALLVHLLSSPLFIAEFQETH